MLFLLTQHPNAPVYMGEVIDIEPLENRDTDPVSYFGDGVQCSAVNGETSWYMLMYDVPKSYAQIEYVIVCPD